MENNQSINYQPEAKKLHQAFGISDSRHEEIMAAIQKVNNDIEELSKTEGWSPSGYLDRVSKLPVNSNEALFIGYVSGRFIGMQIDLNDNPIAKILSGMMKKS